MVAAFAGASAPGGWLLCDGSAVSRATYAALFAVIGTTYGAGNGSTTFNVPDLRGRAIYGVGPGTPGVASLGATEGQGNVALRGPHHGHSISDPTHSHGVKGQARESASGGGSETRDASGDYTVNAPTGIVVGSQGYSVQNAPSHMGLNYLIKV